MKKVVFLFFIVLSFSNNIFAKEEISSLDVAIDALYIDPIIDHLVYNEISFSLNINEDLSIRIPLNVIIPTSNQIDLIGFGGSLDILYRPFFNGFLVSFSLIKVEYLKGYDAPYENIQYLNKLAFGYTFDINKNFYIEPSISFFNLNGVYEDSILTLKESFGNFSSIRPSILVGYKIIEFKNNKEEG